MSDLLVGKLSDITGDNYLSRKDYAELEQVLFQDGGVIDENEWGFVLDPLLFPLADSDITGYHDEDVFEDPADRKKMELLVREGAYSLERYVRVLADYGLEPSTPIPQLEKVAREGLADELPTVETLSWNEDGSFTIFLRKPEGTFLLQSSSMEDFEAAIYASEFSGPEVIQALIAFEKNEETPEEEKETARLILQSLSQTFQEENTEMILSDEKLALEIGIAAQEAAASGDEISEEVILKVIGDDKPVLREHPELPPLFYGLSPSAEHLLALKTALQSLPPEVTPLLGRTPIHLMNFSELAREFYKTSEDTLYPVAEWGGLTMPHEKGYKILLSLDQDPWGTAFTLVHEIGHVIYDKLCKKSGKVFFPATGEGCYMEDVLQHHIGNLKEQGVFSVVTAHPTTYSFADQQEWFANAFAIYYLGKRGEELPKGFFTLISGETNTYAGLLEDFKTKDPVGYLMMDQLDQNLEREIGWDAWNWSKYQTAEALVKKYEGEINESVETEWRSPMFDTLLQILNTREIVYQEAISVESERARLKEIGDLNEFSSDIAFLYPFKRDTSIWGLRIRKSNELSAEERVPGQNLELDKMLMDNFLDFYLEDPFDWELSGMVDEIVKCRPKKIEQGCDGPLIQNQHMWRQMEEATTKLKTQFPHELSFQVQHAYALRGLGYTSSQEKKPVVLKKAGKEFSLLVGKAPSLEERHKFLKEAIECFANGGDSHQATELLLALLKEKPDNFSAKTAVQIVQDSGDPLKLVELLNLFADSSPRRLAEATKSIDQQVLMEIKTSHADKWQELCDKVQLLIDDPRENFNDPSGKTKKYMRDIYQAG